jgi:uncharacterized membrane protein YeaQ/YmgE (transglycosylase-associated protein family)
MGSIIGFVWFIIMGGIIGWLASMVTKRDAQMGTFWNIVVGIVGSFIGNGLFGFVLGGGKIGAWPPNIMAIIAAFIGAVALLAVLNLMQRGSLKG